MVLCFTVMVMMMKNKDVKILFIFFFVIGIGALFFLIIHPLKRSVSTLHYDSKSDNYIFDYGPKVEEVLTIDYNETHEIVIFLDDSMKYGNLRISLYDFENNTIFSNKIKEYNSFAFVFEFPPISKGKYKLVIEDLDGDSLRLETMSSDEKNYVKGYNNKALRVASYYRKINNFYFWYPFFLFTFLFAIYPFVWVGETSEK